MGVNKQQIHLRYVGLIDYGLPYKYNNLDNNQKLIIAIYGQAFKDWYNGVIHNNYGLIRDAAEFLSNNPYNLDKDVILKILNLLKNSAEKYKKGGENNKISFAHFVDRILNLY